jgi:Concanavalin A-like lectin/glucanases superfamily
MPAYYPTRTIARRTPPSKVINVKGPTLFTQNLAATLSSTATLNKRINEGGFMATLSFSGSFAASRKFLKNFSATLFSVGGGAAVLDDGYVTTSSFDLLYSGSPHIGVGQTFTSNGGKLAYSTFFGAKNGSPTGNIVSKLYSVVAGNADTLLATSDPVAATSLVDFTENQFNFTGANQYDLVAGTQYAITYEYSGANGIYFYFSAFDARPGNAILNDGSGFGPLTGYDARFAVYVTTSVTLATLTRKPLKSLTATFSPVAVLNRRLAKSLVATLSFVGALTRKLLDAGFSATLSFVGNLTISKLFVRALTATLNFTGALSRRTGKVLGATLSFVGVLSKNVKKQLSATLSFVGNLATQFVGGAHLFLQAFTATLTPAGLLVRSTSKTFSGVLSPSAALNRRVSKFFTGTLSFVGALTKKTAKGVSAVLSFVGNLATSYIHPGTLFFQSYTANFVPTGLLSRRTGKALGGGLSFNPVVAGVSFYTPFTIDHTKVPSTQTDFPVLLSVTDARFKTVGNGGHVQNSSGFDIRPYSDVGLTTALTYELERYNGATGEVVMWIKESSLSSSVDTVIYLKYGDASLTTDGSSSATWSNGFVDVYHLKDGTTLNTNSSVASGHNGTSHNGVTAVAGQIDGGAGFASASSQYIDTASYGASGGIGVISLTAWIKATSFPGAYNAVCGFNSINTAFVLITVKSTGKLAWLISGVSQDGTGSNTLSTATWYHVAITYSNAAGLVCYVNASVDVTHATVGDGPSPTIPFDIGQDRVNAGRFWNGLIDEVRVASVVRSANWITTEYNNQNAPGTFMSTGTEVGSGVSVRPLTLKVFKGLTAVLSFVGNLVTLLTHAGAFFISFAATLTPTGLLTRFTRKGLVATLSFNTVAPFTKRVLKRLSGTLSFVGNLTTATVHIFLKTFTASLVFSGLLVKRTGKTLSAVLSFVGVLTRTGFVQVFFEATLVFTGQLTRRTRKFFNATLSFIGLLIRGFVSTWAYYINLRPGQFKPTQSTLVAPKTESTLRHTETESTLQVGEAESTLDYTKSESGDFKNVKTNDNS